MNKSHKAEKAARDSRRRFRVRSVHDQVFRTASRLVYRTRFFAELCAIWTPNRPMYASLLR
jgi:hypothetical protein